MDLMDLDIVSYNNHYIKFQEMHNEGDGMLENQTTAYLSK